MPRRLISIIFMVRRRERQFRIHSYKGIYLYLVEFMMQRRKVDVLYMQLSKEDRVVKGENKRERRGEEVKKNVKQEVRKLD